MTEEEKSFQAFRRSEDYRGLVGGARLALSVPILITVVFALGMALQPLIPEWFTFVLLVVLALGLLIPLGLIFVAIRRMAKAGSDAHRYRRHLSRLAREVVKDAFNVKEFPPLDLWSRKKDD